jgi:hypothetical protein
MSAPRRERNGADQASRLSREEATRAAEMAASVPSPSASPRTGPIRGGGCGRKLGVDILVAHSTAGYGTINGAVAGLSVGDRIAVTDDEADTLEGCSMNCLSPPNRSPRTPRAALPCSGPGPTSSCPTVVCSWPPNRQTPRWPLLTVASPMLRLNVDWSPETNDRCLLKRLARQGRWARGEVSSPPSTRERSTRREATVLGEQVDRFSGDRCRDRLGSPPARAPVEASAGRRHQRAGRAWCLARPARAEQRRGVSLPASPCHLAVCQKRYRATLSALRCANDGMPGLVAPGAKLPVVSGKGKT